MAIIYQFNDYSPSGLLRSFSQQAGDVAGQLNEWEEHLSHINICFENIQEVQRAFRSHLDMSLLKLAVSREFTCCCMAACELETIEKMVEKRDQLIRGRRPKI